MHKSDFSFGYVHLAEQIYTPEDKLIDQDVFVFCRSWERRSIAALKRLTGAPMIVQISFKGNPAPDVSDAEADEILEQAQAEGRLFGIELGSSIDISKNAVSLRNYLFPHFAAPGRKIVFDITSIPKSYTLSIIGWCFGEQVAPALKLFYTEGKYLHVPAGSSDPMADVKLANFTQGDWKISQVPYLEGNSATDYGQKLIAFCGGDHDQILLTLSQYENLSRWAVLTSQDPASPDAVAQRQAASLEESAGLSPDRIRFARALSAVDALQATADLLKDDTGGLSGVVVLPFSTKPHAIAAAMMSLFDPDVTILIRQPVSYVPQDITDTGAAVMMTLADLSAPDVAPML